jgi:hypothetical protein
MNFEYEITELPLIKAVKPVKDYFPCDLGYPADNIPNSLGEYYNIIISEFLESLSEEENEDNYDETSLKKLLNTVVSDNIKYVYATISYPLTNKAVIRFSCNNNKIITYGMLLYLYTKAYHIVYDTEEEDDKDPGHIPGLANRAISDGRFGIWGHDIGDLIYNGGSIIKIYDNYIICNFDCDS